MPPGGPLRQLSHRLALLSQLNFTIRFDCATIIFMVGRLERIFPANGRTFRLLRWSDNLREVESILDASHAERIPGAGDHWHYHIEMELTIFTRGEGAFFVGDYIGPFAAGEVVLLGESLPHHWNVRGSCAGFSVQWNFPPEHAFWAFPETLPLADLFKKAGHGIHYGGRTAAAVATALKEIADTSGLDRIGLLLRVLSFLTSVPESDQVLLSHRSFSLPPDSVHRQAISEAMRYLLANFRNEVRLDTILRLTQMSKATFSRQFKGYSGKTFSELLTHLRLQAARRELVETDRSVLEIALGCGFTEVSFFNRIFHRLLRCNPSEYRARERQQPNHLNTPKAPTRTPTPVTQ
jgi:AraC-like DNA-binding protein